MGSEGSTPTRPPEPPPVPQLDGWADDASPGNRPLLLVLLVSLVLGGLALSLWERPAPLASPPAPSRAPALAAYARTLASLSAPGRTFAGIAVEPGLRAAAGEWPSPGEAKITFRLEADLRSARERRLALDRATARALIALLEAHAELDKIRLVVKLAGRGTGAGTGPYRAAAKVYSFTRASFASAGGLPDVSADDPTAVDLGGRSIDARRLLALGDYVVLEGGHWVRGY